MEYHPPGPWGFFEALLLSAPVKSDLLDPKSWRSTERLRYPVDAAFGKHWLEGNAVVAPDGKLLNILRVDNVRKQPWFACMTTAWNSWVLPTFRRREEIHGFATTGRAADTARSQTRLRAWKSRRASGDTLSLVSSPDLREWRVERMIVSHPDPIKHGFQYVDWQLNGKDLAAVVRVAFDDDSGGANNFHDANYLTFVRVPDFRSRK